MRSCSIWRTAFPLAPSTLHAKPSQPHGPACEPAAFRSSCVSTRSIACWDARARFWLSRSAARSSCRCPMKCCERVKALTLKLKETSMEKSPAFVLSPVLAGVFAGPIAGLKYQTPTLSGFTTDDGEFQYRAGEAIAFLVGGLVLGAV